MSKSIFGGSDQTFDEIVCNSIQISDYKLPLAKPSMDGYVLTGYESKEQCDWVANTEPVGTFTNITVTGTSSFGSTISAGNINCSIINAGSSPIFSGSISASTISATGSILSGSITPLQFTSLAPSVDITASSSNINIKPGGSTALTVGSGTITAYKPITCGAVTCSSITNSGALSSGTASVDSLIAIGGTAPLLFTSTTSATIFSPNFTTPISISPGGIESLICTPDTVTINASCSISGNTTMGALSSGPINCSSVASGTVSATAITCTSLVSSGTLGATAITCSSLTSSGTMSAGTNSVTCGSITSSTQSYLEIQNTNSVAISTSSDTPLTFPSTVRTQGSGISLGTDTLTITTTVGGVYAMTANVYYQASTSGVRNVYIALNGTSAPCNVNISPAPAGQETRINLSWIQYLSAGTNNLTLRTWQNSGGSLNITLTKFSIYRLP